MGRFDTTKATIDANIKQNGNQGITGSVLNSVLKEIVDATEEEIGKSTPFEKGNAEGSAVLKGNEANGEYSLAVGLGTTADGYCSHAEGFGTIAKNSSEHAEGTYNKSNANTIHSVGIGAEGARKNAHEITNDGKHYIVGVGGYDGTNPEDSKDLASAFEEKVEEQDVKDLILKEHGYFRYNKSENLVYFKGYTTPDWTPAQVWNINSAVGVPLTVHMLIPNVSSEAPISTNKFELYGAAVEAPYMTWVYDGLLYTLKFGDNQSQIITTEPYNESEGGSYDDTEIRQELTELSAEVGKKVDANFVNNAIAAAITNELNADF